MISLVVGALVVAAVYFAIVWAISVRINNYGLLDAAWSYGVAVFAPVYMAMGTAPALRSVLLVGLGVAWSVRLGTHILVRVLRHHPTEDVRYQTLRARWPGRWRFLLFFELQAGLAVVFSLPFLIAAFDASPTLRVLEVIGIGVALASLLGEGLADAQLAEFKRNPANRGEVCQVGLWRYSRHPNYFFEWAFWVGIALAVFGAPFGWVAVACPVLMLWFLLQVTGIPLTEQHSVASKGERYREYQRTTSAFVPWFRKA